jgi:hypothetical protein
MGSWLGVATAAAIVAVAASVVAIATLAVVVRAWRTATAGVQPETSHPVGDHAWGARRLTGLYVRRSARDHAGAERPDAPPESYPERPMSREDAERIAQDLRELARTLELRAGVRVAASGEGRPEDSPGIPQRSGPSTK